MFILLLLGIFKWNYKLKDEKCNGQHWNEVCKRGMVILLMLMHTLSLMFKVITLNKLLKCIIFVLRQAKILPRPKPYLTFYPEVKCRSPDLGFKPSMIL